MGERRLLLIGSQCDALPPPLPFLPAAARELYKVLTHPELGGWVPATEPGVPALLLNPSVGKARKALKSVFERASKDRATLFLSLIGHGEVAGGDYYFLPKNGIPRPLFYDTSLPLVQLIKECHRAWSNIDGLIVLLDTCHSGVAALGAAAAWVEGLQGQLRFEMLTAVADRTAADGCFSRALTRIIRRGTRKIASENLRCEEIKPLIKRFCKKQQEPQLPAYNPDPGLYLATNKARSLLKRLLIGTPTADEIDRLLSWFQPTAQLLELVKKSRLHRYVLVQGPAGSGKSALAAALVRPEVTNGAVPKDFVQAIYFISEESTEADLARSLAQQLRSIVPEFAAAQDRFIREVPKIEREQLSTLQRELFRPLRMCHVNPRTVRVVIDGFDRLTSGNLTPICSALENIVSDFDFSRLQVIVTSRPDIPVPGDPQLFEFTRTDDDSIDAYLERREILPKVRKAILQRATGNWLIARLLADLVHADPFSPIQDLPREITKMYDRVIRQAGGSDFEKWRTQLRPILGTLAAAGVGPVLPLRLLCAASQGLKGPEQVTAIRDILVVSLRGYVVRGKPGTDDEHDGLFHQSFAEYLLGRHSSTFYLDSAEAHRAILEATKKVAPLENHDLTKVEHRYAFVAEPRHLWEIGKFSEAIEALEKRESPIPAENLTRWQGWADKVAETLGPDDRLALATRNSIAHWTGKTGKPAEALRLFEALLPDQERALGPDHPDTLTTRNSIAHWTGETGKPAEALRLFEALLPDRERVLGPDHPDTLTTRNGIAGWTGKTGNRAKALRLFEALLPDQERVLGPDHPDTLRTRNSIAHWTGETDNPAEALRLFEALLPAQERVLGPDHPDTLTTRNNIASWTGKTGNPAKALRLFEALLPDQERVLGPDHPDTLTTRDWISYIEENGP